MKLGAIGTVEMSDLQTFQCKGNVKPNECSAVFVPFLLNQPPFAACTFFASRVAFPRNIEIHVFGQFFGKPNVTYVCYVNRRVICENPFLDRKS